MTTSDNKKAWLKRKRALNWGVLICNHSMFCDNWRCIHRKAHISTVYIRSPAYTGRYAGFGNAPVTCASPRHFAHCPHSTIKTFKRKCLKIKEE